MVYVQPISVKIVAVKRKGEHGCWKAHFYVSLRLFASWPDERGTFELTGKRYAHTIIITKIFNVAEIHYLIFVEGWRNLPGLCSDKNANSRWSYL